MAFKKYKDTLYQDKEYTIIKKGVDDDGSVLPFDLWDLIIICTEELKNWDNKGMGKQNLECIKNDIIRRVNEITEK